MSNSVPSRERVASSRKEFLSKVKAKIDGKKPAVQDFHSEARTSHLDDDYSRLSGKPFYCNVVTPTNLPPHNQIMLGVRVQKVLPSETVPLNVTCRGKTWELMYCGDKRGFLDTISWRKFAKDNELEIGDGLFWEVMENTPEKINVKVQIIKGECELSEAELEEEEGGRREG